MGTSRALRSSPHCPPCSTAAPTCWARCSRSAACTRARRWASSRCRSACPLRSTWSPRWKTERMGSAEGRVCASAVSYGSSRELLGIASFQPSRDAEWRRWCGGSWSNKLDKTKDVVKSIGTYIGSYTLDNIFRFIKFIRPAPSTPSSPLRITGGLERCDPQELPRRPVRHSRGADPPFRTAHALSLPPRRPSRSQWARRAAARRRPPPRARARRAPRTPRPAGWSSR
mmetsp:Transcript_20871/g.50032  ORF Transcript_20871/g.50032 Transcript_20871/m.50032 type:complete len:228 (-) Transcript_20871:404-1087(-)